MERTIFKAISSFSSCYYNVPDVYSPPSRVEKLIWTREKKEIHSDNMQTDIWWNQVNIFWSGLTDAVCVEDIKCLNKRKWV